MVDDSRRAEARLRRQVRRGAVVWTAVAGFAAGFTAAVVVDAFADPAHQGAWTAGLVIGGTVGGPLLQLLSSRGSDGVQPVLGFLLDVGPWLLTLGAAYAGMWLAAPEGGEVVALAWVGVLVWPVIAGTVRVVMKRPMLRPPWWAATWPFTGVPVTALIMTLRAPPAETAQWVGGLVAGVLVLVPFGVWRYRRARSAAVTPGRGEAEPTRTPQANVTLSPLTYASWSRRAAAFLIDGVPVVLFYGLPTSAGQSLGGAPGAVLITTGAVLGLWIALLGNRWHLGGRTGQTWGRQAMGIRLVSERTGQPIGTTRAFLRDVAHVLVDQPALCLGWLLPLWDTKWQTLADKMLHTVVIRVGHR